MHYINPVDALGHSLLTVQNPARYLGGEYGQIRKEDADLTVALTFPDLYEIAMSNLAIKIIYDQLNRIDRVRCERVFAPAPDFEELLSSRAVPLYTLESGIPVGETDILAVSLGYEPGITALLTILSSSGIPLRCADRTEKDPVVLAGGCGVTNPAPFSAFIDAFYIGEAEAGLTLLIERCAQARRNGANRSDLLAIIAEDPAVWTPQKDILRSGTTPCARRAIYDGFGSSTDSAVCFPVPNVRIVQDHGVVEIMRGCPNGCRFCHAGMYYRPQRMMDTDRIERDVDFLINRGGYREISLMSLSSGDYRDIDGLLGRLTRRYASRHVSFQLPSLKVNSFTLPLLEKMSEIRKSGLTFAVETPVDAWQLSLNKEVFRDHILAILAEARKRGWSKAKFYFMIGLPVETGTMTDAEHIVQFLLEIQEASRMQCSVNVGTFIPKPHTPYQWAAQLSEEESLSRLEYIRTQLPRGRFKVGAHKPFNSFLEGMISRGDARVGDLIEQAWHKGCRLDAWDDHERPDIWREVIAGASWPVAEQTLRARDLDENLPWDGVSLGVSKAFLKREWQRSVDQILTPHCREECAQPCGICGDIHQVNALENLPENATVPQEEVHNTAPAESGSVRIEATHRAVIVFSKNPQASFIPHLGLIEIWHKALQRCALPVMFSEGFNPLPKFELSQSMSIGIRSDYELASLLFSQAVDSDLVLGALNESLPEGLRVTQVFCYALTRKIRRESLSTWLWGAQYRWNFYAAGDAEILSVDDRLKTFCGTHPDVLIDTASPWQITVPFKADRPLRDLVSEILGKPFLECVACTKIKSFADRDGKSEDFFAFLQTVAESNNES